MVVHSGVENVAECFILELISPSVQIQNFLSETDTLKGTITILRNQKIN
jgi:hypothetical protein